MKKKEGLVVFNWVLKNQIAIGTSPKTKSDINKLKDEGIKCILSLCSEEESKSSKDIYKYFNCERIVLPDHTYNIKITLEEIYLTLDILRKLLLTGPVFVHCKAAIERSPLICIAWLIKEENLTNNQALIYLMQINKGTCPSKHNLDLLKLLN